MGINAGEIEGLLSRFGNEIVNEQVNWATPFVGNGHIQKVKHSHEIGIVRIRETDGLSSTGQIEDGGALPQGSNVSFTKGSYMPKIFFTRLSIPRAAAHLAAGGRDGVRLVREEIEVAGRQLGKLLGQAVFRQPIMRPYGVGAGTLAVQAANATTTVNADTELEVRVKTLAGLYVGQYVGIQDEAAVVAPIDKYVPAFQITEINFNMNEKLDGTALTDTAGSLLAVGWYSIKIKNVSLTQNHDLDLGGSTDTAAGVPSVDDPGNATIQTQVLQVDANGTGFLNNAANAGTMDPMTSLHDCYGTGSLYGITQSNFTGNRKSAANGLSIRDMRNLSTQIKRRAGYGWHMLVMNSSMLQRYFETGVTGPNDQFTNFLPGSTVKDSDGGSMMPTFQGLPIVVDENVADEDMFFFNKDDVKLAEFKDFATDKDGGGEAGMVDRSKLIYDTQIWGMYNMRCTRRNSGAVLTNVNDQAATT